MITASEAFLQIQNHFGKPQSRANGKIYWTHNLQRQIAYCENCKFVAFRKKMISIYVHFNDTFEVDFNKAKNWYNETESV